MDSRKELFERQIALLGKFLKNGAIGESEYRRSREGLERKMGFSPQNAEAPSKEDDK